MSNTENKDSPLSFLQNKQVIHIACEVIVLSIIVYYFSRKNSDLTSDIRKLIEKLKEHEQKIVELESHSPLDRTGGTPNVQKLIEKLHEQEQKISKLEHILGRFSVGFTELNGKTTALRTDVNKLRIVVRNISEYTDGVSEKDSLPKGGAPKGRSPIDSNSPDHIPVKRQRTQDTLMAYQRTPQINNTSQTTEPPLEVPQIPKETSRRESPQTPPNINLLEPFNPFEDLSDYPNDPDDVSGRSLDLFENASHPSRREAPQRSHISVAFVSSLPQIPAKSALHSEHDRASLEVINEETDIENEIREDLEELQN